jgi:inosine-uridine nucleoside N-ribohydrolase
VLKLHLDTDLGGDIDDLCALALALDWPAVELLAVTPAGYATGGTHRPAAWDLSCCLGFAGAYADPP